MKNSRENVKQQVNDCILDMKDKFEKKMACLAKLQEIVDSNEKYLSFTKKTKSGEVDQLIIVQPEDMQVEENSFLTIYGNNIVFDVQFGNINTDCSNDAEVSIFVNELDGLEACSRDQAFDKLHGYIKELFSNAFKE